MKTKIESIYKDLNANRKAAAGGCGAVEIYQIRKNGQRYAKPHTGWSGTKRWTEDGAQSEIARMKLLNPGIEFVVVPVAQ